MKKINILIIDDEIEYIEELMEYLKENDSKKIINDYYIESDILESENTLMEFSLSKYNSNIDIVLIDYQLECSFSGAMVSAWLISQGVKVPRMTLTGAKYPGSKKGFNGHIIKGEILEHPDIIIDRILNVIDEYNYDSWLENQYKVLTNQYSKLLNDGDNDNLLEKIGILLDKFEKIIDEKQERFIKETEYNTSVSFKKLQKSLDEIEKQIQENDIELNKLLRE